MIGILVVTHGNLGKEFVRAVEMISGPQAQMEGVAVEYKDDMPTAARIIEKAFERLNSGDGVIIFTDLLGGTPSNVSLTFLNKENVEVISGVNLPMLLKAVSARTSGKLDDVADISCRRGRDGITAATIILKKKSKHGSTSDKS